MFTSLDAFLSAWVRESGFTSQMLQGLTDASLDGEVAPGHRNLRRLAWHIAQTIPEMMGRTGLRLKGPGVDEPPPTTAHEIAAAYQTAARSLLEQLREHWTDATLSEVDDMYGDSWPRGATLMSLLLHEAHHRGQLTVLMRQAGLVVPGTHGPSREEWGQWGMEPPAV